MIAKFSTRLKKKCGEYTKDNKMKNIKINISLW